MPNKKVLLVLFSLFIILFVIGHVFYPKKAVSEVILGGKMFLVEVADTNISLERGLSGHAPLMGDQGMLFVFQKPDNYGFWMKDMLFPIDIIWIDSDFRVTHIEKSLATSTYPKIFYSNTPSVYVLEVNAGQMDMFEVKIGDTIKFIKR